jgi:hypothetical protein
MKNKEVTLTHIDNLQPAVWITSAPGGQDFVVG